GAVGAELDAADKRAGETRDGFDHRSFALAGRAGPEHVYWLVRARWALMKGDAALAKRALERTERMLEAACKNKGGECAPIDPLREGFQMKLLWQAIDGL